MGCAVAQLRLVQHHAGEERPQSEGNVEQLHGAIGNAERQCQHRQGKQLAGTGAGGFCQDPRHQAAADHNHQRDKGDDFADGDGQLHQQLAAAGVVIAHHVAEGRQQHQCQHHRQVFHDQPADGDLPALTVDQLTFFQSTQQHHGTGGGQTQPEHQAGNQIPAEQLGQPHTQQGSDGNLCHGAGNGDMFYCEEVFKREMEANTEHQQNHANFRQFRCQRGVGNKPGGKGASEHACCKVSYQWGDAQAIRQHTEEEGEY
ncbi:hypothetical protein D3C79_443770 [compost metagenome]